MRLKYLLMLFVLASISCNKTKNNVQYDALSGGSNLFVCAKIESPYGASALVIENQDLYYALLESKEVSSSDDYNSKLKDIFSGKGILKLGNKSFELLVNDTIEINNSTDSLIQLGAQELRRRYFSEGSMKSEITLQTERRIIYALSALGEPCYRDDPSGRVSLRGNKP